MAKKHCLQCIIIVIIIVHIAKIGPGKIKIGPFGSILPVRQKNKKKYSYVKIQNNTYWARPSPNMFQQFHNFGHFFSIFFQVWSFGQT